MSIFRYIKEKIEALSLFFITKSTQGIGFRENAYEGLRLGLQLVSAGVYRESRYFKLPF
jgi:hypothetical protein